MTPICRSALAEGAARLGVPLDTRQIDGFATFQDLLLRWNARIKLTAVTRPEEIVDRHFLDSLAVVPHLGTARTVVDVGSGPGFPGLVLALVRPDLHVTLVESIQKKAAFLSAVERDLGLRNVDVRPERLETLLGTGRTFDLAVSRATFAPAEWIDRGRALVAQGGTLIAMVVPGPDSDPDLLAPTWRDEFTEARSVPYAPGRALLVFTGRRVERST